MNHPSRHARLRLSLLATGMLLAFSSHAQTDRVNLDLAAEPLDQALNSLAQQSGVQILFASQIAAGKQAPALKGSFTPREALERLLAASGLSVQTQGDDTFIVMQNPPATAQPDSAAAPDDAIELEEALVSGDRIHSDLMSPTRQITVIEREELKQLRQGSDNLAGVLSKIVPGMADSSRTITDFGQTLRGRNMLVLVDGVPLNTNRDSSRNLSNINPANIERVEVLRGSSAIYGSGAPGGIVSITTRPAGGETRVETSVIGTTPLTRLGDAGLGAELNQAFSGSQGQVDYEFNLGGRRIGASYDAHGNRIAPEPSQGDLFDSNIYSVGGKLGFRIDELQRLQFSASRYDAQQDTDFAADPAVKKFPAGSVPAHALKGLQLDEQTRLTNNLYGVEYRHEDLWGSELSTQAYYRDYFTRFSPFDARAVSTRGGNVDQVSQNSEVKGGRLTITTPFDSERNTRLVWGADYNEERSNMPLDVFNPAIYDASGTLVYEKTGSLTYMPWVTTKTSGAFGQLQHKFNEQWSVEGGMRYDYATAAFDDFQPLSQSKLAQPKTVQGGDVDYDATLYNIGVVYSPVTGQELYASFSQGFELPDIGLQLRNATASFNIDSSDLEPVKTDNYELGWRGTFSNLQTSLAVFQSRSKLGAVQSFNNGLILTRTEERIHGVEGQLDYFSDDSVWGTGATFTWIKGREKPQTSNDFQDMTGYRIPPLKLTAYVSYSPIAEWNNRLQATYFGNEDYRLDGKTSFGRREVSTYTTVDLISRYELDGQNSVTVGIQNLFNRYYYPQYSQLLRSSDNTSHLPAAGTVLSVGYNHDW
ncbi:TonB-dependent siderophore receptor [Pseudomonas cavernae]|uniref:TonB-dependent siderophore receptor n=1 Tax=Pseudomonas cavernae TaxID=2320867 RepID=UPI0026D9FCB1